MKAIIEDIVAEEEEAERLQRYGDNSLGVVLIRYRPDFFSKLGIMAIPVMEFQVQGYKIKKVFA